MALHTHNSGAESGRVELSLFGDN